MMERKDNYALQVQQAKRYFLTYDQQALIRKLKLKNDEEYLHAKFFGQDYRICRSTGDMERFAGGKWQDANSHAECMTLMDLICDSREDRFVTGNWKTLVSFGHMFHRDLLESRDPFAEAIQKSPDAFRAGCESLGGTPEPIGDISYSVEVFDGLHICLQFWEEDEDFPPQVVWFWDENALMYLKYETMYFAVGLLKRRIMEQMKNLTV